MRLALEKELRSRDWPAATTPAEADLMLVVGPDCPQLRSAMDRLWQDMPQPRVRMQVTTVGEVASVLDAGRTRLGAADHSHIGPDRADGHHTPGEHGSEAQVPSDREADNRGHSGDAETGRHHDGSAGAGSGGEHQGDGDAGHRGHGHGDAGHAGSHGEAEHEPDGRNGGDGQQNHGGRGSGPGGHEGHGGHGHGDMEMPGGLPMAEPGEDRDGLTLDRLHVPLGPFLADWPIGLVIRVVLQGDVIQQADLAAPPSSGSADAFWTRPWLRAASGEVVHAGEAARWRAAAHLDSLGRLLSVVGWPAQAVEAQRLRDDMLDEAQTKEVLPRVERLARRVGRSRTLYWLSRGIGPVSTADARAAGVTGPAARAGGDVPARYRQWLTDVVRDVLRLDDTAPLDPATQESPRGRWDAARPPSVALAKLLPQMLEGAELSAARLIVASLDPDPDELTLTQRELARG
ncbi:hypothetical protein SLI_1033 [Streptomyces lividans 1326]|uniref:Uncharacterized protein n=2 Tax=Streptomyces TaxID=1883 RepID=A0A7U9DMC5_STRLI|nr:hypothetical protein SLI_1033 [Streptomyces lividans 1326]